MNAEPRRRAETDTLTASLERLQTTVLAGIEERKRRRREVWDLVRTEAPEHAEWIAAVSAAFGRLARVRVRVGGVVLLDSKTL